MLICKNVISVTNHFCYESFLLYMIIIIGWGCSPHFLQNRLPFFYGEDYTQISFLQSFVKINGHLGIEVLLLNFFSSSVIKNDNFLPKNVKKKVLDICFFCETLTIMQSRNSLLQQFGLHVQKPWMSSFMPFSLVRYTLWVTLCNLKEMYSSPVHLKFLVFVDKYSRRMV